MDHNEQEEIDNEINAELSELIAATNEEFPAFSNPAQLQLFLRKSAVRRTVRNLPFSSYLRQFRRSVDVSFDDFAKALNIAPAVLEQVEARDALPWNVQARLIADIAEALRLHIAAVEGLANNSLAIAKLSRQVSDAQAAEGAMRRWLRAVTIEFERRGAHDLLD